MILPNNKWAVGQNLILAEGRRLRVESLEWSRKPIFYLELGHKFIKLNIRVCYNCHILMQILDLEK